jgi:SPP1 gp7 family putative phage head morphogenesis protein
LPESLALSQSYAHALIPMGQKDIYGPQWRAFQGITDSGSGLDEIQDNPRDWSRARGAESYIFRAQDVRGSAIDSVPLRVWSTDERGRRSAVPHPAIDLLEQNVPQDPAYTPYVSGSASLMRYTLLSMDGHGRCAWQLAGNARGAPTEIYWLTPLSFRPLHGYDVRQPTPFGGIEYSTGAGRKVLDPTQIVYFSTDNPDDPIIGTSKVSILRNAINLRAYSQKSNMDFFKHSMRPDWILTGEWKNNEENIERIKRGLRRHYSGESNREPMVLGEGAKAQLLTTSQKDAEWQAMMRIVQEEISAIYGVPVVYLNNMERATYQNIETAKLMLWHDTMMPETKKLAAMLTQQFLYRFWPDARAQGLQFGFDYNTVTGLNEDVARIWERFNALTDRVAKEVETRQITPNQARQILARLAEQLGLDPTPWQTDLPDGNTFYLPFNNLPTSQLSVQGIMNIEASRSSSPLAPDLIENVPGAPTAETNAQRAIARQEAADDKDRAATVAQAAARPTPQKSELPTLVQGTQMPQIVTKGPNPLPIREARLAPIQKRMGGKLKAYFQDLQTQSLRTLRGAKALKAQDGGTLYDREKSQTDLRLIVRTYVGETGKAAFAASAEDFNLSVSWSDQTPWVEQHMGKRLTLIDGIDDTTVAALSDSLAEGATAGETVAQLADRVSAVFSDAIDTRAETIARTETIQAYGSASIQSYREAGVQVQMYDGSGDPECAAVNGMIVSPDEADALMASEHPNGTRGCAPVVDLGFREDGTQTAGWFRFDHFGVAVA